jgi:hypothetical protein
MRLPYIQAQPISGCGAELTIAAAEFAVHRLDANELTRSRRAELTVQ